ncbi:MAG: fimbrial biogenesis chaperone [Paludibacteraceae bacterium]
MNTFISTPKNDPRAIFFLILTGFFLFAPYALYSQVGISVSPPRVYYNLTPGETGSQKVLISNISKKQPLNLSITFGDWKYDDYGNNIMLPPDSLDNSCANWLTVPEGNYLTLNPGENREIDLTMSVPLKSEHEGNVQTAIMYVTQMNPLDDVDAQGAAIKINVRQGIKIYRKGNAPETKKLEIQKLSFDKEKRILTLVFDNNSNIWLNGRVTSSLFNQTNGKETDLKAVDFYTMPNDHRIMTIPIQNKLEKGNYTVTVMIDYNDKSTLEAAELEFSYD